MEKATYKQRPMGLNGPYVNNHGRTNLYFQLKKNWTRGLKYTGIVYGARDWHPEIYEEFYDNCPLPYSI